MPAPSLFQQYAILSTSQLCKALKTTTAGLTSEQADNYKKEYGSNSIAAHETRWYTIALRQVTSPFIYILVAVAFISWLLHDGFEPFIIIGIVLLNCVIGFYQEYNAHEAAQVLQQYLVMKVKAIRDGNVVEIPSTELVPGDVLTLFPGDIIPADVRFIVADGVSVDESILTGESKPNAKTNEAMDETPQNFFDANNIGFSGTILASGHAQAVVFATGMHTAFGTIAQLTTSIERTSNFSKNINLISSFMLRLIGVSVIISVLAHLLIKGATINIIELALFTSALAVSVIPEALPIVTTFALSQGALHLAKQKMVIKRLSAIEDLGNVEILATDKTGTLTQNKLEVTAIYSDDQKHAAFMATLVEFSQTQSINPASASFHTALLNALTPEEQKRLQTYTKHMTIPFDPVKRMNRALIEKDGILEIVMLAIPEEMITHNKQFTTQQKTDATQWALEQGKLGNRVLVIAKKQVASIEEGKRLLATDFDATIIGMIAFTDPLKPTSKEAIARAKKLGISIKILSGDAREVCGAVGYEIGLINDRAAVITGAEFASHTLEEQKELVKKYHIFARILPDQKYLIIHLLQEDAVVGYLGDGVNDAPALKEAHVALAVQNAARVAYEAADIILLGKSLMVIINGIAEGRKTFANTLKYIRTALSTNFGNFYAIAVAALFIDYLPMLPAQLLFLNILSDLPMIAIATDNVSDDEVKKPSRYDIRGITLIATALGLVSTIFDFIVFAQFSRYEPAILQTSWFLASILTELLFIFSIRTRRIFFKGAPPSWQLASLALFVAATSIALPYTKFGQDIFLFVPLSSVFLLRIAIIVSAYFITTEAAKLAYYRLYNNSVATS